MGKVRKVVGLRQTPCLKEAIKMLAELKKEQTTHAAQDFLAGFIRDLQHGVSKLCFVGRLASVQFICTVWLHYFLASHHHCLV